MATGFNINADNLKTKIEDTEMTQTQKRHMKSNLDAHLLARLLSGEVRYLRIQNGNRSVTIERDNAVVEILLIEEGHISRRVSTTAEDVETHVRKALDFCRFMENDE
jgi:hypothetical protein